MALDITARVFELTNQGNSAKSVVEKAIASVVIDGHFAVNSITVCENKNQSAELPSTFLSLPSILVYGDDGKPAPATDKAGNSIPATDKEGNVITDEDGVVIWKNKYEKAVLFVTDESKEMLNSAVLSRYTGGNFGKTEQDGASAPHDMPSVKVDAVKLGGGKSIKAVATVKIDESIVVKGVKVVENKNGGLSVLMPGYKDKNGEWKSYANPTTSEFREKLNAAVIAAYQKKLATAVIGNVEKFSSLGAVNDILTYGVNDPKIGAALSARLMLSYFNPAMDTSIQPFSFSSPAI